MTGRAFFVTLFVLAAMSAGAQTTWLGGGGDWYDASKWSNGVPSGDTGAVISPGGVVLSTDSSVVGVPDLVLSGGSAATPTFLATAKTALTVLTSAVVGRDAGSHSFIMVSQHNENSVFIFDFFTGGTLTLGAAGTGELNAMEGTDNSFDSLVMGDNAGSHGILRITGAQVRISEFSRIANSGSATVAISQGGSYSALLGTVEIGAGGGLAAISVTGSQSQFIAGGVTIGSASTFDVARHGNVQIGGDFSAQSSKWTVTEEGLVQFSGIISTESSDWEIASGGESAPRTLPSSMPQRLSPSPSMPLPIPAAGSRAP